MSEQPWLRMPVGFGPTVSPRYAPGGGTFDPATSQRRIMVQAVFDTDADAVRARLTPWVEALWHANDRRLGPPQSVPN